MRNRAYRGQGNSIRALAVTLLCGLLTLSFAPLATTRASFGDIETSENNLFGASSLDIAIELESEDSDSLSLIVHNDGASPFNYGSYTLEVSDPLTSFCSDLLVSFAGAPEVNLLSHSTNPHFLDVSATEDYELEFSVLDEEEDYTGKTCAITFIFEASQVGFNQGEAFFDTDTYTTTLYGEDFGSAPTPDPEPDTPCCACGDVTVENENEATIITVVNSGANTGGNNAGGGGVVTTADATTITTIVNNVNTNSTTVGCENDEFDPEVPDFDDFFGEMF